MKTIKLVWLILFTIGATLWAARNLQNEVDANLQKLITNNGLGALRSKAIAESPKTVQYIEAMAKAALLSAGRDTVRRENPTELIVTPIQ